MSREPKWIVALIMGGMGLFLGALSGVAFALMNGRQWVWVPISAAAVGLAGTLAALLGKRGGTVAFWTVTGGLIGAVINPTLPGAGMGMLGGFAAGLVQVLVKSQWGWLLSILCLIMAILGFEGGLHGALVGAAYVIFFWLIYYGIRKLSTWLASRRMK